MDFKRNLTSRDFFKAMTNQRLIGSSSLTPALRYEQARWAQRCRNFWWTATVPVPTAVPVPDVFPLPLIGMTERFSEPVIITDMLSMVDQGASATSKLSPGLAIFNVGGEHGAYGDNYFGLSGPVPQQYLLKYERNNASGGASNERPSKWLGFVPRLVKPYETLRVVYSQVPKSYPQLQVGLRGLRVLAKDNPYQYLPTDADKRLKAYIDRAEPETFYTDVSAPMINVRNATGSNPVVRRTLQMDRPLLVLGAACNAIGVQAALYDESKQYRFDAPDRPLNITQVIAAPYKAVPLTLWAPNTNLHNVEMFNMWPVPHLLQPGAILRVTMYNGLNPDATGDTIQATTRQEEEVRITFICRTV